MAKKLGLALGSGAARGWAHLGVLGALEEAGLRPDVIAGTSVGALVGGAYAVGAVSALEAWARELSPLSAFGSFALAISRGGLVDTGPAFDAFREFDRPIADLDLRFGAVATCLGTGEEVWLTEGSTVDALKASSAIPVLFHAVNRDGRWLVDGALANPTPVSLARALGADVVVAVDLCAVPKTIDRFVSPPPSVPAVVPAHPPAIAQADGGLTTTFMTFVDDTRRRIDQSLALAKSRQQAEPHLAETAFAAADIFQMHLSQARMSAEAPDVALTPDMRDALPTAFDRADEFIETGRAALHDRLDDIRAALDDQNADDGERPNART